MLQTKERPTSDIDPDLKSNSSSLSATPTPQDPDVAHLEIDVGKIVKLLVKEEELVTARTKAEDMERENVEMQAKLAKKEQDLDQRLQEKEDLETSLTRMRERLEKESASHSQAVQRALNAEMRAEDLQHRFVQEQHERSRLERLVNEGSIPDDQKVAGLIGCNGQSMPPPPPMPMVAPPPPPPLFNMPPPPPPCPGGPPPPSMQIPNSKPGTLRYLSFGLFTHNSYFYVSSSPSAKHEQTTEERAATHEPTEEFQLVKAARRQGPRHRVERVGRHQVVQQYRVGEHR